MSEDGPEYGYAADARPLWDEQNWAAEQIRILLRAAGCPEFPALGGFSVNNEEPFLVAPAGVTDTTATARYTAVLTSAGYRVEPFPDDEVMVQAWPPAGQRPIPPPRSLWRRACGECGEQMTRVESAASRTHGWAGRCADCQDEHLAAAADDT
ncbi:hypothetical protein GCM10010411_75680 [Actinomadura fulvescens]|uniref:Uncharacterized protein n=1 Tax=Actinomadura fulvescens TaxID=46160 RepID=A0ABN3QIK0_9ACTN